MKYIRQLLGLLIFISCTIKTEDASLLPLITKIVSNIPGASKAFHVIPDTANDIFKLKEKNFALAYTFILLALLTSQVVAANSLKYLYKKAQSIHEYFEKTKSDVTVADYKKTLYGTFGSILAAAGLFYGGIAAISATHQLFEFSITGYKYV